MGLDPDYFDNMLAEKAANATPPPVESAPVATAPATNERPKTSPFVGSVNRADPRLHTPGTIPLETEPVDIFAPDRSQDAIQKKFGGEIGSEEYYRYKAEHPYKSYLPQQLGSSLGMQFPDSETWDAMSVDSRIFHTATEIPKAFGRLIKELPREIVRAPIRVGITIAAPWQDMAQGKSGSLQSVGQREPLELPWLGTIPTYFNTFEEAKASGLGTYGSLLTASSLALGDVSITGSLAEATVSAFRPRNKLAPGETVGNIKPIEKAFADEKPVTKIPSNSEYYSLPKTVAKNNGGNSGNTFFKVTPAGPESVQVSVVQIRSGKFEKAFDYARNKFGVPEKNYLGDFGPEKTIQSKIVKVNSGVIEGTEGATATTLKPIPSAPLKGFEKAAIKQDQMTHLIDIAKVNGIETGIRDAVIETITGKKAWGEMTQAEYVQSAQTIGKFNNIGKYAPEEVALNKFSSTLSPQRHWMRAFEEKGGLPIYSEIYVPMENATRLRNVFRTSYRNEARDVFGKYQKSGFGPERQLVHEYMKGNTKAITGNPALEATTKTELIKVADDLGKLYDKVGPELNVPKEIFLEDYQPSVQNIGGVYQLYKEGTTKIPKEIEFFAKFKKRGNVNVAMEDSLGLFDIYVNSGSNATFLNPVLERAAALGEKLPANVHNSVKSYTLEKMGYAGKLEEFLDNAAVGVNRTLNTNLPPDTARQMTTLVMDTTYSGALGANPGKAVRNLFQNDLMTYPRLGPKYYGQAAKDAFDPKLHAEVREAGFLVELGVPFGEELAKDVRTGAIGNKYRKVTQATLGPYSMADQVNRVRTYRQLQLQFEDGIAKYNKGNITWEKLEKELDFNSYGPANRQLIRADLIKGDMKGAFDNMVRDVLDETHFPYRKGASSRITYGLTGKIGTQFLQWPIEFAHTQARWIATGQYEKLIRFWGSSSAISRSFKDAGVMDTTNFMFYNSLANPDFSPTIRSTIDFVDMLNNMGQNNAEQLDQNKEDLSRAVKTLGVPAGAQIENVKSFLKSYFPSGGAVPTGGPIGPNGDYPVYTSSGKLKYYSNFSDLWKDLWGFTTVQEQNYRDLNKSIRNDVFDRKQAKRDVLQLYQQEKFTEANEIIGEYGINISPSDFDQFLIPLTQRTYNNLPDILKAKFAPQIFPQ